jgi:5,10-methylenetetrahydromethanopterin reductase
VRFGFGAVPARTVAESVRLIEEGERLGYDRAWVPDQTFHHDPFVILAEAARATSRIGLMLGVANPFTRHPVQVARSAASLDELSAGRITIGYGAGNRDELVARLGLPHTHAAERCREAVAITRRLLAGEEVTYQSRTLSVDRVRLESDPRPDVPIFLGARGPRILAAAGEVADGVIIGSIASASGLAYALASVRAGARKSGRELSDIAVISWVGVTLTDDGARALDELRPRTAHVIAGHRTPVEVLESVGLSRARIAELRRAYAERGTAGTAPLITAAEVSLFALVGTADECRSRIEALAAVGVTELGILLQQRSLDARVAFLERFAEQVMRPLRAAAAA